MPYSSKAAWWMLMVGDVCVEAGGDDEFQGRVEYTFTRPDGTQLGTQGQSICVVGVISVMPVY